MVDTSDPRDFRRRLERQRQLLDNADIPDADRVAIERFVRRKDGNVSISTLKTYLRRLRRASEWSDTPLVEFSEAGWRSFVFDLRHDPDKGRGESGLSDATLKSYEDICLQFLGDECGREWAADIERTSVDRESVDAAAMLGPDDIAALRDAARHQRDVALVGFLADTGARISLVCSLRVRDVSLDGDRATYQPNGDALGLKGAEVIPFPIIDSRADLRTYLRSTHPRSDKPDAALFHRLRRFEDDVDEDDGACDPSALRNHLVRLGNRADVEKPTNPHNFRHSAITRMVREGFSRDQIEHRVHWSLDTDMWERYVHVSAEQHNSDIFSEAGIVESDEAPDAERRDCGTCRTTLAPHHEYCPRCGEAASPSARSDIEAVEAAGLADLKTGDLSDAERRAVVAALHAIREDNSRLRHE